MKQETTLTRKSKSSTRTFEDLYIRSIIDAGLQNIAVENIWARTTYTFVYTGAEEHNPFTVDNYWTNNDVLDALEDAFPNHISIVQSVVNETDTFYDMACLMCRRCNVPGWSVTVGGCTASVRVSVTAYRV